MSATAVTVTAVLSGSSWAAQASQAGAIQAHRTRASQADVTHAVFVQTNDPSGNSIVAFRRNSDGTLTLATSYRTGGNGGRTSGSASDPLSSQGSLVLARPRPATATAPPGRMPPVTPAKKPGQANLRRRQDRARMRGCRETIT
jgi:hypothetical protein